MKTNMQLRTTAAIVMMMFVASCATIAPGNDPVVVRVEQATVMAVDTIDAFLLSEFQHRESYRLLSPDIERFANVLRREVPPAVTSLREITKTYKTNRNEQNKANMITALAVVQSAASQAANYIARFSKPSIQP
jgi:hypothetical protein